MQAQVIAGVAHGGEREVGVGTARIRGGVQALGPVQHRHIDRRVLEHKQAVEQRLAFGQFAALLNRHQRQVLVLAQLHIVFQQGAQPLPNAQHLTVFGHLHTQGHTVDKQPDCLLHLRQLHRAPGHGNAKHHVALTAQAPQHQRPCRLGKGVDGQLVLLRQFTQPHAIPDLQPGVAIAHQHAAASARMLAQQRPVGGDVSGPFKALQVALPPGIGLLQVLLLQPADVLAITRRRGQLRGATFAQRTVDFEKIAHQQRAAPGIDEDVVIAHHEPVTRLTHTDQAQVERRLIEQIKTGFALALEQRLQTLFMALLWLAAPVEVVDVSVAGAMDDLQHAFARVPTERRAQGLMPRHHRLPGLGETLRV